MHIRRGDLASLSRSSPTAYPDAECACLPRRSFRHRCSRRLSRSGCVRVSSSLRRSLSMGVNRRQRHSRLAPSSRCICGVALDSGPTFYCAAPTSPSRRRDHSAPKFGSGKRRSRSSIGSALRHDLSCRTGVSLNRVFDISGATECARGPFGEQFYCLEGSSLAELRHRGTSGFVVGGGLRFKFRKLWLEPELRLTRWVDRNFGVRDSAVRSNLNQIGLLAGVVF